MTMESWQTATLELARPGRGHKAIAAALAKKEIRTPKGEMITAEAVATFLAEYRKARKDEEKARKTGEANVKRAETSERSESTDTSEVTDNTKPSDASEIAHRETSFESGELTDTRPDRPVSEITDLAELTDFRYASDVTVVTDTMDSTQESVIAVMTGAPEETYVSDIADMIELLSSIAEEANTTDIEAVRFLSEVTDVSDGIPDDMKTLIRQIVQEEIRQTMETQTPPKPLLPDIPLPPRPRKIDSPAGRKIELGDRVKLGISVDSELARLLAEWQNADGRKIGTSQAIDAILWQFFHRPALSHDLPDAKERALHRAGELDAYRKRRGKKIEE
jgi:hypothetical protein